MGNFYLLCGISGGGKTTLSKKLLKLNTGINIVDIDEYYEKINGDECDRRNPFKIWTTIFNDLHSYEEEGKDVLIVANLLTVAQRRQFIEWFPTFIHHLIWVISPKDKCIEGNMNRKRHLPEDVLMRDWELMEFPNAHEEGWKTITHVTNCWNGENYILFNLKGNIEDYIILYTKDKEGKNE